MGSSRNIAVVGVLALTVAGSGCAAKTNFSFPSFGLINKDNDDEADRDLNPNGGDSQRLIDSPSR